MNAGNLIDNRYVIQRFLGQGGFGRTYLVSDTQRFGEACVLKEFVPANIQEDILHKSYELFGREARVLYRIDHPQIPKFIAWFKDKQKLFIVQEYIEGKTYAQVLRERLSQTGSPFSEAEVVQWLWDMLPVLDYIHKHNLIHRDISLENVMLPASQSKPVLIDFGLVKEKISQILSVNNLQQAANGSVVGKFGYAPLEQIRKGECYPCSDIYTLGVCAVALLTGKTPDLLLDHNFDWQWHSYVKVSDGLTLILDKMLAEKPAERYQSAIEILQELELPTVSQEITAINSIGKIEINIDQVKRERQVAEIVESDEFKLLEQRVNNIQNKIETSINSPLEVRQYSNTAVSGKPALLSSEETVSQEIKFEQLDSKFINYCLSELSLIVGSCASLMIKNILVQYPNINRQEFIETLAGRMSDRKSAQNFKQRIEIAQKGKSGKEKKEQTSEKTAPFDKKFGGNIKFFIGIGVVVSLISASWFSFMAFSEQPKNSEPVLEKFK